MFSLYLYSSSAPNKNLLICSGLFMYVFYWLQVDAGESVSLNFFYILLLVGFFNKMLFSFGKRA